MISEFVFLTMIGVKAVVIPLVHVPNAKSEELTQCLAVPPEMRREGWHGYEVIRRWTDFCLRMTLEKEGLPVTGSLAVRGAILRKPVAV